MECPVCEHRQRKFICQSCVRTHLRELRAQIVKAAGERQAEVEKAAKLLGSGVEHERWARAEKHALQDLITAVNGELSIRRNANRKASERVESLRQSLNERRENLRQARDLLPPPPAGSTFAGSQSTTNENDSRENTIPFASNPSPPRRFSRLFHFPTSSAPPPPSPPPTRRHRPPDPLVEAKQALADMGDALAETRSVLVRELADVYELQAEVRMTLAGHEEHVWTIGRMLLPMPDEITRYKPSQLHATLHNTIHFMRLTAFYLGVKLPFEIAWGASSRSAPPFQDLLMPSGTGEGGPKLDTVDEDGEGNGAVPTGVGIPWIVAGRGLGGSTDGGWGKCTAPLALYLPSQPRDAATTINHRSNLKPAPVARPHRNQPRSTSSPGLGTLLTSQRPESPNAKRRPSLLSLARVSAAAKYVATSAYGSSPLQTPTSPHSRSAGPGLPTRSWTKPSSAPKPRQRSGSVSIHQVNPPVRARVASLVAMPSRAESPLPGEKEGEKDTGPQVQTPLQAFVAALTRLQYNAAYLAWTQGALNIGNVENIPGVLELLGATVTSEGIGFGSHVTSAAQEHALPPPTRSFSLSFSELLGRNIARIGGGGLMSAGLSHDGDGEWDLIEASEEEDGVG